LVEEKIIGLIQTYKMGRIARDGIRVVIAGKPNVGKSSLLNRIANENRAIVNEMPGTTRDVIEVQIDLHGILYTISDTAGIKATDNPIENEGIFRAKRMVEIADIILHVFDGSIKLEKEDRDIMVALKTSPEKKIFRLINKIDKAQNIDKEILINDDIPVFEVSAHTGEGIERVKEALTTIVVENNLDIINEEVIVTEIRHVENLKRSLQSVQQAKKDAMLNVSSEFISVYLREALEYLGEIIGVVTSEDILNNIFSKFCIGK
jgi:tRNA modification GTPase